MAQSPLSGSAGHIWLPPQSPRRAARGVSTPDLSIRIKFGPLALPPLALVVLGAAALALYALAQKRRGGPGLFPALASVWGLSLLAPLSWMALAKMHCQIHTHLVPMLWNFALAPATLLALGALAHQALRPAGKRQKQ